MIVVAPVVQLINDELERRWFSSPWILGGSHRGGLDARVEVGVNDT